MTRRVYLDFCATTPVHPEVCRAMLLALDESYGNPSSLHWAGREANGLVEAARETIARLLGARPAEVVFTSGATEADNLALLGVMHSVRPEAGHLITSAIEHHAVLHAAEALRAEGYSVTVLPVDSAGRVDPDDVRRAIRPETRLISVMMVNNEVGSLQATAAIGQLAREHQIAYHVDAVQAIGLYECDVRELGVDLLALSGHKIYGPKGVGALYVRDGVTLTPTGFGGPQEAGRRPGTQNVPGIIGLAAAMALVAEDRPGERLRLEGLRQRLLDGLRRVVPQAIVNVPPEVSSPHVVSVSFPGADGETLLLRLDQAGVAASMGSACNAEAIEPSHVLRALGLPSERANSTLRFSTGRDTREDDIDYLLDVLPQAVASASL